MKIAILGTRGIPNYYGGFEQCAQIISTYMVKNGHDVTVYNPDDHPFKKKKFSGVKIQRIFSNEKKLSVLNVFLFDFLCLCHALLNKYDIILELGYHPASLFYFINQIKPSIIVTNFAGMEWKRSKWNGSTQKLIKYCEKIAVRKSDAIIADNIGIQDYIKSEYKMDSYFSAYGAELFYDPDEMVLNQYNLKKKKYFMMMARFQKDNNFEMILDGYVMSGRTHPFIVVGDNKNTYGNYLRKKYKDTKTIFFVGGIYDYQTLSSLRWYAQIYFHGHSCGGTNPSLLEAMASNAFIAAHDNQFNKAVLNHNGLFFQNSKNVSKIINSNFDDFRKKSILENKKKVALDYNWDKVCNDYLRIFNSFF